MVLNIYPLEQSLRRLAGVFGAASSNREHIGVFVSMLKSLRFTFDHEELVSGPVFGGLIIQLLRFPVVVWIPQEAAMQLFQCHYRETAPMSGLYFDYITDILHAASQGASGLSCKPPPCLHSHPSPGAWLLFLSFRF